MVLGIIQQPLNQILTQMERSLPYLFSYSLKSRTHTLGTTGQTQTTFAQRSIMNTAWVVTIRRALKCHIAVTEISNKAFIRAPRQLKSLYIKREIAGFKGAKQTKRTITAWKKLSCDERFKGLWLFIQMKTNKWSHCRISPKKRSGNRRLPLTSFLNASTRGHSMKPTGEKW